MWKASNPAFSGTLKMRRVSKDLPNTEGGKAYAAVAEDLHTAVSRILKNIAGRSLWNGLGAIVSLRCREDRKYIRVRLS